MCFDAIEGQVDVRRVVHGQHDAGDDLHDQHEREDAAERPPVVQIARRRINDEGRIDEASDRQPPLQPLHEGVLRRVDRMCAHGRTLCVAGRGFADPDRGIGNELMGVTPRRLRCGDCCQRLTLACLAGYTHPRCQPPAPFLPTACRRLGRGFGGGRLGASDLGEIRSDQIRRRFIGTLAARVQVCQRAHPQIARPGTGSRARPTDRHAHRPL